MENEGRIETSTDVNDECEEQDGLLLYDYVNKLLSDNNRLRFERHLQDCICCQKGLSDWTWFAESFRGNDYKGLEKDKKPRAMGAAGDN
jgi:hypothetical protein